MADRLYIEFKTVYADYSGTLLASAAASFVSASASNAIETGLSLTPDAGVGSGWYYAPIDASSYAINTNYATIFTFELVAGHTQISDRIYRRPTAGTGAVASAQAPFGVYHLPSASTIFLNWANGAGIAKNKIYRASHYYDSFECIASTLVSEYTDTGMALNRDTYYFITAIDGASNESIPSPIIKANTMPDAQKGFASSEWDALEKDWDATFDIFRSKDDYPIADIMQFTSTGGDITTGCAPTVIDISLLSQPCLVYHKNKYGFAITELTLPDGRLKNGAKIFVFQTEITDNDRIRYPATTGSYYEVVSIIKSEQADEWYCLTKIEA